MRKKSIKNAHKLARTAVNKYVRLKGCLDSTGSLEYGLCFICGKQIMFEKSQAGHFLNAGNHAATRYDEMNLHINCGYCNTFAHGNKVYYYQKMREVYGQDAIDKLILRGNAGRKWKYDELKEIEKEYKEKINQLQ